MNSFVSNLLGAVAVGVADRLVSETVDASGVDTHATIALISLYEHSGESIKQLAVRLGVTHSGAVRVVDRLEGLGLANRITADDRRSRVVELTSEGVSVARQAQERRASVLRKAIGALDPQDQVTLTKLLAKLAHSLADGRDQGWMICRLCEHSVCRGDSCPVGSGAERREIA